MYKLNGQVRGLASSIDGQQRRLRPGRSKPGPKKLRLSLSKPSCALQRSYFLIIGDC
jgi:hypothetical protein